MKYIISILSLSFLLLGCSAQSNFLEYPTSDEHYTYIIDEHTDVVYLQWREGYKGGITVLLNSDGTPVTAKQLELYNNTHE